MFSLDCCVHNTASEFSSDDPPFEAVHNTASYLKGIASWMGLVSSALRCLKYEFKNGLDESNFSVCNALPALYLLSDNFQTHRSKHTRTHTHTHKGYKARYLIKTTKARFPFKYV